MNIVNYTSVHRSYVCWSTMKLHLPIINSHFFISPFQLCILRWCSVLHHIIGVHRWEEGGTTYTCHHPALSIEEQQEKKRWLEPQSPAFLALKDIVTNKNLLQDMRQMALFKHTGTYCFTYFICITSFPLNAWRNRAAHS